MKQATPLKVEDEMVWYVKHGIKHILVKEVI